MAVALRQADGLERIEAAHAAFNHPVNEFEGAQALIGGSGVGVSTRRRLQEGGHAYNSFMLRLLVQLVNQACLSRRRALARRRAWCHKGGGK